MKFYDFLPELSCEVESMRPRLICDDPLLGPVEARQGRRSIVPAHVGQSPMSTSLPRRRLGEGNPARRQLLARVGYLLQTTGRHYAAYLTVNWLGVL